MKAELAGLALHVEQANGNFVQHAKEDTQKFTEMTELITSNGERLMQAVNWQRKEDDARLIQQGRTEERLAQQEQREKRVRSLKSRFEALKEFGAVLVVGVAIGGAVVRFLF